MNLDFAKRNDCVAIHAVSCLARQMQMSSVTEGIGTLDHAETVVAAGCNELQGFKPVPANKIKQVFALPEIRFA